MKKALVIGCPGSGKSTFARGLSEKTGLPVVYLDMLYWNADKTTVSREEFDARLAEAMSADEWIIDGNFSRTMERRLEVCDTVFFFDMPTDVCIAGVRARRGKIRPEMPWVETDEDEEFMDFIRTFGDKSRPVILELLERYREGRETIVFHSHAEADGYLESLN